MQIERWQFRLSNSIAGLVLIAARRNGRGLWAHPREIPGYVRQYLCADERGRITDKEVTLDLIRADKQILAQRTPRSVAFKGILAVDLPPGAREAKRAAQKLARWKARGVKGIYNLRDLHAHVGSMSDDSTDEARAKGIAHRLYKDTECGIGFYAPKGGRSVVVSGYCEGTDAECPSRELLFPFKPEEFDLAVRAADEDGCDLWNQTHGCPKCGMDGAINPHCKTCKGQGQII